MLPIIIYLFDTLCESVFIWIQLLGHTVDHHEIHVYMLASDDDSLIVIVQHRELIFFTSTSTFEALLRYPPPFIIKSQ